MNIVIVKRDKSTEPFSSDKLIASITKAGVPVKSATEMSQNIYKWITETVKDGKIESTRIRDKIHELLLSEFPVEAENFIAFKKS